MRPAQALDLVGLKDRMHFFPSGLKEGEVVVRRPERDLQEGTLAEAVF